MLIRIVRMTFDPARVDDFLEIFEESSGRIRSFEGCRHLELWQDARFSNVFTTFSHWEGPEFLEAYRKSDLFKSTWARTTPLFAAPPTAQSYLGKRSVNEGGSVSGSSESTK
jgi:quinol monooxygenase YgiN